MNDISEELIRKAIAILGESSDDTKTDNQLDKIVTGSIDVERLATWPPEAFAMVLISHSWDITLPKTFSAKSKNGSWKEFEFNREPIFVESLKVAQTMYHNGPRENFGNIAKRSAMLDAINSALNAGDSIEGASLAGPALLGVPAEIYEGSVTSKSSGLISKIKSWFE